MTSTYFHLLTLLFFGLVWLGCVAYMWLRKGKGFTYLLLFSIFFVYLYKVLDYTLLQFQSLLLLKLFMPNLMLKGSDAVQSVNLIPLSTLTSADLRTSLLNILLMVPFGFGLPFITKLRMKGVVVSGVIFSIVIELLQFLTGFIGGMTFRVADVNDVIFNTLGALAGYLLYSGCKRFYRRIRTAS